MKLLQIAMIGLLLLAFLLPAAPAHAGACSIIRNRNGVSVTVDAGPCYVRDFPVWCRKFVPAKITQGQTVPCPVVVITPTRQATATPTPRATPAPTRSVLERLKRVLPPGLQRGLDR